MQIIRLIHVWGFVLWAGWSCQSRAQGLTQPQKPAHTIAPAQDMAEAAQHFLAALNSEQKSRAEFEWRNEERFNWHFVPRTRAGLAIKEMTAPQRQLAHALLASGLSSKGHMKASTIMSLEQVLQDVEGPQSRFSRDPELYFVSIFGRPGMESAWGWRVEGHHLSINISVAKGGQISATPSFLGANPAEVKEGPRRGLRVLAAEEDLARRLVESLDPKQRKVAIISPKAPSDILSGVVRRAKPLKPMGLATARMRPPQRDLLLDLLREYVFRHRPEIAERDMQKIKGAGLGEIHFAWAGGLERGQGHYYRVQGPTFLMEYDCTQNQANHIHTVWRDFEGDFGEDTLGRHYEEDPHHR